jgi:hypothetical protein
LAQESGDFKVLKRYVVRRRNDGRSFSYHVNREKR